jgi:predicted acyl esterase
VTAAVSWLASAAPPARLRAQDTPTSGRAPVQTSDSAFVREHYAKHEYRIPMRDGARLYTAAYLPRDASATHR